MENDTSVLRHLPSYEEATLPYSLRLPTYRSSYIRRFHPYPRYVTPLQRDSTGDCDEDVLDLSILDYHVRRLVVEHEPSVNEQNSDNGEENAIEGGEDEVVVVDVDPVIRYDNGGEQLDPIFIRLEVKHSGSPSL